MEAINHKLEKDKVNLDETLSLHRAERLRRLRNLANLNRKEFCDVAKLNFNTYTGYEVGKYGGLSTKSAYKIIKFLATKGIFSSLEWLMHGSDPTPKVITDLTNFQELNLAWQEWLHLNAQYFVQKDLINPWSIQSSSTKETQQDIEEEKIIQELNLFKTHYTNTIDCRIHDDTMAPYYQYGEHVAGIKNSSANIQKLCGLDCIIQTMQNEILVRNLQPGRIQDSYTLTARNPNTKIKLPILYDVKIKAAANIIWHRRPQL